MALVGKNGKSSGTFTTDSGTPRKKSSGIYDRAISLEHGDIQPVLTLNTVEDDKGNLAFGYVGIKTSFGGLVIDNVAVKRDKDGDLKVSLPFKVKADKQKGGKYVPVPGSEKQMYIDGPVTFVNLVRGDGAFEVMRYLVRAYEECLTCENCKSTKNPDYMRCSLQKTHWQGKLKKDDDGNEIGSLCLKRKEMERPSIHDQKKVVAETQDAIASAMDELQ